MTSLSVLVLDVEPSARILFGGGSLDYLAAEISALGADSAFVVTDRGMMTTGIIERVTDLLGAGGLRVGVFADVEPNPSTETIDVAAAELRTFGNAVVVAVGGGSALDAAKGIALLACNAGAARTFDFAVPPEHAGRPIVAIPTTSGTGAETNGFGVIEDRENKRKVYIGHSSVRPALSILDAELTVNLPSGVTAATGMDALTHGIESLASKGSSPLSAAYATEAIRLVNTHLHTAVTNGADRDARAGMLLGAHLAGRALSLSGLGMVHGIAHAVTNRTGAPHGLALTAVLDTIMERSADVATPAYTRVAAAMGLDPTTTDAPARAVGAVRELGESVGARRRLSAFGVTTSMAPDVAAGALADPVSANHPRPFSAAEIQQILLDRL